MHSFIFLMCSERSGSNLITRMMDGHPEVCGPFPKHLINPLARNLFRYGDIRNETHWQTLLKDVHRLLAAPFTEWRCSFSLDTLRSMADVGDPGGLVRAIFAAEANAVGKSHIFVKENQVYEFLPFLMHEFPAARYLFLVRDPRDMALSWKRSPIHVGGVVRAARQWVRDQRETLKHAWVLARTQQVVFVRYEDLIADAKSELRRICLFLNLPYSDAMLNFHHDALAGRNVDGMQAWQNLTRGLLSDNKEKFRDGLSEVEVMAIERLCGPEMSMLGYSLVSNDAVLESIDEATLDRISASETGCGAEELPNRVRENMEAKKAFYQHAEPLFAPRRR